VQKGSATLHVCIFVDSIHIYFALIRQHVKQPGYNHRKAFHTYLQALPSTSQLTLNKGEICALENSGRLPASAYRGSTMYTTLSPCDMCTGACILYKVSRVVMGENANFVGGEKYLKERGVEVVNLEDEEMKQIMGTFIKEHPELWFEDIGE